MASPTAAARLVLEVLAHDFLRPQVVNAALDRELERILAARGEQDGQRARLQERLSTLDVEGKPADARTDLWALGRIWNLRPRRPPRSPAKG